MVVHVVESSSCDIYRLVWITIITPPLHTFFTQKQKQKSDFFDGFVEESEKEYVNHHEASNTEMLVRLGRQLISSSSHCLCSYKKINTHTHTHTQTTNRKSIETQATPPQLTLTQ